MFCYVLLIVLFIYTFWKNRHAIPRHITENTKFVKLKKYLMLNFFQNKYKFIYWTKAKKNLIIIKIED